MRSSPFFHFLLRLLYQQKGKHIGAMVISVLMIFLLSSVLFVSSALQHSMMQTLQGEPDFTVSRVRAGVPAPLPLDWIDEISQLNGVTSVVPRVYGRYYFTPKGDSFLVVGVDMFDEQNIHVISTLLHEVNLQAFLAKPSMFVGEGVKHFLKRHYFSDHFNFKMPNGHFKEVAIVDVLPHNTNLLASNMVLMPLALAQEIFGFSSEEVSDISFNVPNDAEWRTIQNKLQWMFYDVRVVTKKEIKEAYIHLFNYKGGLFLALYLVAMLTFMLILYQRYTMVYTTERKEIGILRAVGWSINDILRLKLYENMTIVGVSFLVGVVLAYGYVFLLDAPLLRQIFLGSGTLLESISFVPYIPFGLLGSLFLMYAVPFLVAVLVPAWRVAVTPPKEAML